MPEGGFSYPVVAAGRYVRRALCRLTGHRLRYRAIVPPALVSTSSRQPWLIDMAVHCWCRRIHYFEGAPK